MNLIEILLPLTDEDGRRFDAALYSAVRDALVERFGGMTAFTRAPAEGLWEDPDGGTSRDEIVIFEVMADNVERRWCAEFRKRLERDFRQDEIVVRARAIERL